MSLIKLLDQLEQSFMTGRKMAGSSNDWAKMKIAYKGKVSHEAGAHTLNFASLHERTGSRGNGIGMGHRNQQRKTK